MNHTDVYADFQAAYLANLEHIRTTYNFEVAPRGQASFEKLGIGLKILNPKQRICQVAARKTNIIFNFAEVLWYLSGSNRTDVISYYAPSLKKYSADGIILTGTAYGPRIFGAQGKGMSQWDRVAEVLKHDDPVTKRGVITIFESAEDISLLNIDVSCTMCLQFLLRQGRLHLVVFMRANDAYRGIVSDIFSFTFLQEVMARQVDAEMGEYHHFVGSMHLYKTDLARVSEVLATSDRDRAPRHEFPSMPPGDNWPYIKRVLEAERSIREDRRDFELHACKGALPEYWYQIVLLLMLFRRTVKNGEPSLEIMEQLWPIYRDLVRNRWPTLWAA